MARRASTSRDLLDDVVAAVYVYEEHAGRALEQGLRSRSRSVFGENVGDIELPVLVARTEGPNEAVLRLTVLVAKHSQPRLIRRDNRADADQLE